MSPSPTTKITRLFVYIFKSIYSTSMRQDCSVLISSVVAGPEKDLMGAASQQPAGGSSSHQRNVVSNKGRYNSSPAMYLTIVNLTLTNKTAPWYEHCPEFLPGCQTWSTSQMGDRSKMGSHWTHQNWSSGWWSRPQIALTEDRVPIGTWKSYCMVDHRFYIGITLKGCISIPLSLTNCENTSSKSSDRYQ